ncbi:hypothetical protein ABKV19_021588 [Rosa sericea]
MALAISLGFLLFFPICSLAQGYNFSFRGFKESDEKLNLILEGDSIIMPSGMIRLTNATTGIIGHAFYQKPIAMFDKNSSSYPNASSFSTEFVFAIVSPGRVGFGLAFTLSPSPSFPGAEAGQYFGIFNSSNDNKSSNHILAVEFDTVNGYSGSKNSDGNHVGIDINSVYSIASEPASYYTTDAHKEEFTRVSCHLLDVKLQKITRNGNQGMREFAAEIESLGQLRHKNLVNLQGWCKKKTDLLLVYDYIPNGSLDTLIFHPRDNFVLSWEQRFNIIRGIASGLLYLHEEWEQVVIHRDVKSRNVLIDADLNARLSDFGLARLHDHGKISHTTGLVGTIGYIAPELAQTGKASASSDVFAYGILLLEVASGRRPIGSGHTDQFILAHWVMENHQAGRVLDTVDPKLGYYVEKEMELVLQLGLLCSHFKPEARPTMRQVVRYLNSDEPLPHVDNWDLIESERVSEINSRLMQGIYSDPIISSSFGGISSGSMAYGR